MECSSREEGDLPISLWRAPYFLNGFETWPGRDLLCIPMDLQTRWGNGNCEPNCYKML
jgi:hypothetical protein